MTKSSIETEPKDSQEKRAAEAIVADELRWLYLVVVGFLYTTGAALLSVGLFVLLEALKAENLKEDLTKILVYTILGAVILILGFGARQVRRYLLIREESQAKLALKRELDQLDESSFEKLDEAQRIREEKARRDFEINLRSKIQVDRVEARSIQLFPHIRWDMQPGVNVLLGRNGYGKSLLLRGIAGLLQRDEEATEALFPRAADSGSYAELYLVRDDEPLVIRRNTLRFVRSVGKVPILAIPDSRLFDRSDVTFGPEDTETTDLRELGAFHFLHQRPYGSVIRALLYEICLDYWEEPEKKKRTLERPLLRFLEECVRRLTGFEFKFYSIDRRGRAGFEIRVITEGSTEPLPIQYASQGTLSVLATFGLIRSYLHSLTEEPDDSMVQKGSGIVLIDEADAHLHPTWQQRVPSLLKDLFPNVQFIVSAHSPLFVAGCWGGEVAVLRRCESDQANAGFAIEQLDRDFVGASAAEIYEEIFEIEELDPTFLEYTRRATTQSREWSTRINALEERRESEGGLTADERRELRRLTEMSRRIRRVGEIQRKRKNEDEGELRVVELEAQVLKLEAELERLRLDKAEDTVR